ncbi:MAG: DNA internalization-related competence protein ComEC/Rec2 [Burkholderiales bacterium]|nr:DNA internalization-related competence protein ComEC/Rec2 [Burkholderiales bacterium]
MRLFILGFLIGVCALQMQAALPVFPAIYIAALGLAATLAAWLVGQRHSHIVLVIAALLALSGGAGLGFGWAQWRAEVRMADSLPAAAEVTDIEIIGAVASLPQLTDRGTRFEFDIEKIVADGKNEIAVVPSHISLTWYVETNFKTREVKPPPTLSPGERWHFTVRLKRPHGTMNPHGFDFEAWALERNIRATGYIRVKGVNKKLPENAAGFMYQVDRMRLALRDRMLGALKDDPYRGVLIALAIGEQSAIPTEQWKVFWRTGTGHLMSISGLHITMVASLIYWLAFRLWARIPLLVLRLPAQRAAAVAGALAALAYALIAGFSVPTQRTFFMLAAIAIALWFGRGWSASRILAWALLAVLLLDPWAGLAPGFWLSFGCVAMIFYVTTRRIGQVGAVASAIKTQIAVTLGLLPVTLALFQEVSIISPLANAFAIPLVSLMVVPITLAGALMPFDFVLQLAHLMMSWCYAALAFLSELPNAVWQSHAPAPWTAMLAMIGVVWLLLPRGAAMRWVGIVAMLPLFMVLPPSPKEGELWVTLLDVGQGLAIVVRTANHAMVYDTGPRWNPDADSGNRIVAPYLRGEGIRVLDALVVSHADEDHSGGAKSIIDMRKPKWVLTSMDGQSDVLRGATEVMRCEWMEGGGDTWRWDGVEFDILHPAKEIYDVAGVKTNNLGCVLKITARGGSILMTADIEKQSENQLLERFKDEPAVLKSDVMVVPHHGSRTSSTDAFIDAVAPTMALVPVGYRSRFRHPNSAVMARYAARNIPIYRTDFLGAITLKFAPDANGKPMMSTFRQERQRYWIDQPQRVSGTETNPIAGANE